MANNLKIHVLKRKTTSNKRFLTRYTNVYNKYVKELESYQRNYDKTSPIEQQHEYKYYLSSLAKTKKKIIKQEIELQEIHRELERIIENISSEI